MNKLKDLAMEHDYHCHYNNFYSNKPYEEYGTWSEFSHEYSDADVDMNLVFRFDVYCENDKYHMMLFMIQQRKGIFKPIKINVLTENDATEIIGFLSKHFFKLKSLWLPISHDTNL